MIIDLRVYRYEPSKFYSFLSFYASDGFPITTRHLGTTLGIFTPASGVANRTFQFFAYEDHDHRDACRAKLRADPDWHAFIRQAALSIVEQQNTILTPAPFSQLQSLEQLNAMSTRHDEAGVFDWTTHRLQPGKLEAACDLFAQSIGGGRGDEQRSQAAFIGESGDLNQISLLTRFANSGDRARKKAAIASNEQLGQADLAVLSAHQEFTLLEPTPYSPLI